jgi:catechol 2,3-dioxygenase-like lactoylglutathione lyase family enzyme
MKPFASLASAGCSSTPTIPRNWPNGTAAISVCRSRSTERAIYYTVFYCRDEREPAKRLDTTFSIMPAKKALPLERSEFMVNYRVDNLEEFLEQLRRIGIEIEKVEDYDYGRFAWIRDPEGNRIELYQPLPASETH